MTPEEQFQKIENALRHTSELQASQAERIDRIDGTIEKQNESIQSLLSVSRTHQQEIQGLVTVSRTHQETLQSQHEEIQGLVTVSRTHQETLQSHHEGFQALIVACRKLVAHGESLQASVHESVHEMLASAQAQRASIEQLRILQASMMEEMRELNKATEEKLNMLIDIVDRIIRRNGSQERPE